MGKGPRPKIQAPLVGGTVLARCSATVSFRMHREEGNTQLLDFACALLCISECKVNILIYVFANLFC